jgi:hypothetical protein
MRPEMLTEPAVFPKPMGLVPSANAIVSRVSSPAAMPYATIGKMDGIRFTYVRFDVKVVAITPIALIVERSTSYLSLQELLVFEHLDGLTEQAKFN